MKLRSLLGIALLALAGACTTKPPTCAEHFAQGEAPAITSESLAKKTQLLCFEGYATTHSGVARTPLWSAEHLTAQRVDTAKQLKRKNTFHAEDKLPAADRAELADYARSGFDRGHMAPSGDMPTETAQYESFSLANMIPQNPNNNQNLWENIEQSTRHLARQDGEIYVVTGPLFEGSSLQRLNGRVLVPTAVFKAIYTPRRQAAAAYVTPMRQAWNIRRCRSPSWKSAPTLMSFQSCQRRSRKQKCNCPSLPRTVRAAAVTRQSKSSK